MRCWGRERKEVGLEAERFFVIRTFAYDARPFLALLNSITYVYMIAFTILDDSA